MVNVYFDSNSQSVCVAFSCNHLDVCCFCCKSEHDGTYLVHAFWKNKRFFFDFDYGILRESFQVLINLKNKNKSELKCGIIEANESENNHSFLTKTNFVFKNMFIFPNLLHSN